MNPQIVGLRAYPLCLLLGAVVGTAWFVWRGRSEGLPTRSLLAFGIAVGLAGLMGGRIYEIVAEGEWRRLATWANFFSLGLRQPGVMIGTLVSIIPLCWIFLRPLSPLAVADLGVPAVGVALGIARLGCFFEGCCYGVESNLPWAVHFPLTSPVAAHQIAHGLIEPNSSNTLPVHPLQLYFALASLSSAWIAYRLYPRRRFAGHALLVFFVVHETSKFLLEQLRAPDAFNGGIHLQVTAAGLATVAMIGLVIGWMRTISVAPTLRTGSRPAAEVTVRPMTR